MIRDRDVWEKWEFAYRRKEAVDFPQNLRLLEGIYEEARSLGIFPLHDPWERRERRGETGLTSSYDISFLTRVQVKRGQRYVLWTDDWRKPSRRC
jgi:hypothetical protein